MKLEIKFGAKIEYINLCKTKIITVKIIFRGIANLITMLSQ